MKRLLSSTAGELLNMTKKEKLLAIQASEGRTMVAEVTMHHLPQALQNASMPELYARFGADLLLLNMFDVFHPQIPQIEVENPEETIRTLRRYTGKFVGLNLEPVPEDAQLKIEQENICAGRMATVETAKKARDLGVDYIVLTGNPGTGVNNEEIVKAAKRIKEAVGDDVIIMAGKMHAAGSITEAGKKLISKDTIQALVQAGADVILMPAPGTVPGISFEYVQELVEYCHELGVMTLTAIGTSQEEADAETIRRIALMCKMAGTDIHHIGDAGYSACTAESILTYSIVIRGKRHTYNRIASSVLR